MSQLKSVFAGILREAARVFLWVFPGYFLVAGISIEKSISPPSYFVNKIVQGQIEDIEMYSRYLENTGSRNTNVIVFKEKLENQKTAFQSELASVGKDFKRRVFFIMPFVTIVMFVLLAFIDNLGRKWNGMAPRPKITVKSALAWLSWYLPLTIFMVTNFSQGAEMLYNREKYTFEAYTVRAPPPEEIAKK
jgi:hypothetical protein